MAIGTGNPRQSGTELLISGGIEVAVTRDRFRFNIPIRVGKETRQIGPPACGQSAQDSGALSFGAARNASRLTSTGAGITADEGWSHPTRTLEEPIEWALEKAIQRASFSVRYNPRRPGD